jgi:hypothetical protein
MYPFTTPEIRGTFCMENGFNSRSGDDFHGLVNLQTAYLMRPQDPTERYNTNDFVPLGLLLSATAPLKATVPVDKIYALLGVSNSYVARSIWPNYGTSTAQVFFDTAVQLLQSGEEAGYVFPHAGVGHHIHRVTPGLPSWVPDWASEVGRRSLILTINPPAGVVKLPRRPEGSSLQRVVEAVSRYTAGGEDARPSFVVSRDARTLTTRGLRVDTVQMPFQIELDTTKLLPAFYKRWLDLLERFVSATDAARLEEVRRLRSQQRVGDVTFGVWKPVQYVKDDPAALPRTLTADRAHYCSSPEELQAAYNRIKEKMVTGISVEARSLGLLRGTLGVLTASPVELEAEAQLENRAKRMAERINQCCAGRKVAVTFGGKMALVPPLTQKGDAIFLVEGLQVPYVFRKTGEASDEEAWELVGECYLDGAMNGEMLVDKHLEAMVVM